jgi:hypothetical protein
MPQWLAKSNSLYAYVVARNTAVALMLQQENRLDKNPLVFGVRCVPEAGASGYVVMATIDTISYYVA